MKILCPKCGQIVPANQVNMATDLALCPACNEGFKVSETVDRELVNASVLDNPPRGAWFRQESDRVVVGATTRSPVAFFLVPFMCVWSGGALGGIYGSQIAEGKFNLGMSVFGIPFVLGSILFWTIALMAIWGKTEVTIGRDGATVFVGIGRLGWSRRLDWLSVKTVREEVATTRYPGSHGATIVIEGKQRVTFGTGLNEARRYFVLNALKYLHSAMNEVAKEAAQ